MYSVYPSLSINIQEYSHSFPLMICSKISYPEGVCSAYGTSLICFISPTTYTIFAYQSTGLVVVLLKLYSDLDAGKVLNLNLKKAS